MSLRRAEVVCLYFHLGLIGRFQGECCEPLRGKKHESCEMVGLGKNAGRQWACEGAMGKACGQAEVGNSSRREQGWGQNRQTLPAHYWDPGMEPREGGGPGFHPGVKN